MSKTEQKQNRKQDTDKVSTGLNQKESQLFPAEKILFFNILIINLSSSDPLGLYSEKESRLSMCLVFLFRLHLEWIVDHNFMCSGLSATKKSDLKVLAFLK